MNYCFWGGDMKYYFWNLREYLFNFLKEYKVDYMGLQGPLRGSKICTVWIKGDINHLQGKEFSGRIFFFTKEFEGSTGYIKYWVSCPKKS